MSTITLPQATKTMQAGTLRRWRKKPGEAVKQGEVLAEIETDEGLLQLEAATAGTLQQILVEAGRTVAVNTQIAVFGPIDGAGHASPAVANVGQSPASPAAPATKGTPMPTGSVTPILMPKAGQSMEEGVLVKWHVKPGDRITKGQVIFEIETDKATMEVEATDAGRLSRIVLAEGGAGKVLEPVAYLAENDADVDGFVKGSGVGVQGSGKSEEATERRSDEGMADKNVRPTDSPALGASTGDGGRVKASPAARKVASDRGIDLSSVGMGSGPGGRILSTDVPVAAAKSSAPAAPSPALPTGPAPEGVTRKRMSKMRMVIARNLLASKQTIPHFYVKLTINAEPLQSFYQAEKAKYPCSLNDVIVMACGRAIMEFPAFRSRIEGDEMVTLPSANVGIAVGMDDGLVVPVVMNAQQLTLKQIGAQTKRIATNARSGKIEGMGSGVFTITNMGMFGTEEFSAIINPPEAAILAVGAIREEVIVSGGTMRAGKVMTMTLSADHRVIDGMLAAKFMARLKELLEWPGQMM